jgi:hypothetical protein
MLLVGEPAASVQSGHEQADAHRARTKRNLVIECGGGNANHAYYFYEEYRGSANSCSNFYRVATMGDETAAVIDLDLWKLQ